MKKIIPLFVLLLILPINIQATVFFTENFNDATLGSHTDSYGHTWYDGVGFGYISTTEKIGGTGGSFECHFITGGTGCANQDSPLRHLFGPSDSVYISYWIKHSSNWIGSDRYNSTTGQRTAITYHPHMIYLLTTLDTDYKGFFGTHLTTYVEENQGYPMTAIADGSNVDTGNITAYGVTPSLYSQGTQTRAVAGCNGTQTQAQLNSWGNPDCWATGGGLYDNEILWRDPTSPVAMFFDPVVTNQWHFVEAYFQMNTVTGGATQENGVMKLWVDGVLLIDQNNIIYRTAARPTQQFKQFGLSPYININGSGSAIDQYLWIDELTVGDSRPSSSPAPLNPPSNLRIQ